MLDTQDRIQTLCKDCIFRKNSESDKNIQIGCNFHNRLEKFTTLGEVSKIELKYVAINELVNDHGVDFEYTLDEVNNGYEFCLFEDGKFHHLIDEKVHRSVDLTRQETYYSINRICSSCRNNSWLIRSSKMGKLQDSSCSIDSMKTLVEQEISLKLSAVIYLDKNSKIQDIQNIGKDLSNQLLEPHEVIFVKDSCPIQSHEINACFSEKMLEANKVRIVRVIHESATRNSSLDESYRYVNGSYVLQIDLPCRLNSDFISNLDNNLNEKLEKFSLLEYKDNPNLKVIQSKLIKDLSGNSQIKFENNEKFVTGIENKIKYIAEAQKQESYTQVL